MNEIPNKNSPVYDRVSQALDLAIELLIEKKIVEPDHYGHGIVLCGLLTMALLLEDKDDAVE